MKCRKCQAELAPNAAFCGACGEPVATRAGPVGDTAPAQPDFSGLQTVDGGSTIKPVKTPQQHMAPGETFADRYVIKQLIGEGGMGVVYRATDKLTEKDVALKLIRADRLAGTDAVKRLIREGVTSRDIRHSNVVAVYDVGETDGQPYMSMEFLAGRSLRSWNKASMQGPEMSMATAANIIRQILDGLEAAHKAGVIHRDLKPENVILMSEPSDKGASLKLLDFGIARAPGAGDTGSTSLGTRGYMAPEQLTAPDAALASADLFSLSVMFYELLVGVVPQTYWQPPSGGRSDVPQAIDKLIEKGLSANPRGRPQSVAEYRALLEEAMKPAAPQPPPPPPPGDNKLDLGDLQKAVDWMNKGGLAGELIRRANKAKEQAPPAPPPPPPPVSKVKGDVPPPPPPAPPEPAPPVGKMSGWKWFMHCLTKRYYNGKGRATHAEYWGWFNWSAALGLLAFFLDAGIATDFAPGLMLDEIADFFLDGGSSMSIEVTAVTWALLLSPGVSVAARRLHDAGRSGWMAWPAGIPVIGTFFALGIAMLPAKPGANAHGPDPREAQGATG